MIELRSATLLDGIPRALSAQPWVQAVSYAFARQMARVLDALPATHSWTALDGAPDAVLDNLAVELHARGYEQTLSAARKRDIIRNAFDYWAHAGTVASVEDVLYSTFGAQSRIEDWYMYDGGQPGYFRITTNDPSIAGDALTRFKQLAEDVKRLSAWLDSVNVNAVLPLTRVYLAAFLARASRADLQSERLLVDLPNSSGALGLAVLLLRKASITLSVSQPIT